MLTRTQAVLYYTWIRSGSPTDADSDDRRAQNSDLSESLLEENIVPKPVDAAASVNTTGKGKASAGPKANAAFVFTTGVIVFIACCFGAYGKISVDYVRGPSEIGCEGWQLYKSDDAR